MRKLCWQRWTLIFLLMARLVVGELGHAMPVADMASLEQATAAMVDDPPCAEHDGQGNDAASHPGGEHDCCKSGDCECPCLHVPCLTLNAVTTNPVSITLLRMPYVADAVTSERPSGLFRPPA